jgi:dolichol-phosphate mannosyltransferase
MKIAVVIAAYNESANIRSLTTRLVRALDALESSSWRLIYVIDGTDATLEIAREFAAQRPEIEIIYNERPSGLGRAFLRGFQAVPDDADYVVTMDADLNHQPEEITKLLAVARELGSDIVVGSRRLAQSKEVGVPFWKDALSRTVNRMMHFLMGVRVNDLTSGFRVYRASALRQIHFENVGFAFLPEILVDAASKRFKIVEEPIRFVFREAGESKMHFAATSVSYLKLFAIRSVGLTTLLTIAVLALGIGIRIGFCFPVHHYYGDADAVLAGQCALDVLHGQRPLFFPGGYRLSSQSCYVTAAMFGVFGPTRTALGATSLFYGLLFLVFSWLALREASGSRAAVWGLLLIAMPPLQFWLATYPVWGYPEVVACCACVLWLGFRLLHHKLHHPYREALLYGLCVGFSFWTSPQTVMISIPITALLLLKRRLQWRQLAVVALAFLVSLWPYYLVAFRHGMEPFSSNFAMRPVSGSAQLISNLSYLLDYTLPLLFFSERAGEITTFSTIGIRVLLVLALLVSLVRVALRARAQKSAAPGMLIPPLLPLGLFLFGCALYAISSAGTIRGWTVRYAAPLWLTMALAAALIYYFEHRRRTKLLVIAAVIFLSALNAVEYPLFNRELRQSRRVGLTNERAILSWLQAHHRDVVIGDYWTVYSLNFDGARSVVALPIKDANDYFHYDNELRGRYVWAVLLDNNPDHLQQWAKRVGMSGHLERISGQTSAFVFDGPLDKSAIEQARAEGE